MKKKLIVVASAAIIALSVGAAYAVSGEHRVPTEYFVGHTHADDGGTVGAPQHSGGLNRQGCHNASVPYHCH